MFEYSDIGEAILSSFGVKIELSFIPSIHHETEIVDWEIIRIDNALTDKEVADKMASIAAKFLKVMSPSILQECLDDINKIYSEMFYGVKPEFLAKYAVHKYLDILIENSEEESAVEPSDGQSIGIVIDFSNLCKDYKSGDHQSKKYNLSYWITEPQCQECGEQCETCYDCDEKLCCCECNWDDEDDDEDEDEDWDDDDEDDEEEVVN